MTQVMGRSVGATLWNMVRELVPTAKGWFRCTEADQKEGFVLVEISVVAATVAFLRDRFLPPCEPGGAWRRS